MAIFKTVIIDGCREEASGYITVCLDDISQTNDYDFLELSVQGDELDALSGAEQLLDNTVVVHTEVESPNQPLSDT
jgi:hypothetical protein